jgi:PEP-CTERM motif
MSGKNILSFTLGRGLLATSIKSLAVLAMVASTASAVTIVRDNWRDGSDADPASPVYSENGVDADADGNRESAWFQGGGGSLEAAGPGGPLEMIMDGGPAGTSSSSWTTYFTPEASPVNLANANDRMVVTWKFTTHDVNATNGSQNFRIAVVDSPTVASRIVANGTPGNQAYKGYAIFGNMGETFGHAQPYELFERTNPAGASALLSSSSSWTDVALATSTGTNGNQGYDDSTLYTFTMEYQRTAAGELRVSSSIVGGTVDGTGSMSLSVVDTTPQSFVFDTFALRPSSASTTTDQFDTHLFRVDYIPFVPEPSSLVLLSLGGLALVMRRRRGC